MNGKKSILGSLCIYTILCLGFLYSCTHDPFAPIEIPDVTTDTTTMDTTVTIPDTTSTPDSTETEIPCDTNLVYFNQDILPLLKSNCALSGCHDAASAKDGVILESYNSVMTTADVVPFNLNESDLYEVLVEDDEDKKMPPAPRSPLSSEQISLIAKWILTGAENLTCEDAGCDLQEITFAKDVNPVIATHCKGCHSGNNPSGGVSLESYGEIKTQVDNGGLIGAITWADGFSRMPQGQDKLNDCTIEKIKKWIDEGAPNN